MKEAARRPSFMRNGMCRAIQETRRKEAACMHTTPRPLCFCVPRNQIGMETPSKRNQQSGLLDEGRSGGRVI